MYEVEIELLICGINHVDGSVLILSDNESKVQIPHSIVGVEDELENVVNTIFKEYCNINITWAGIAQIGTIKRDNSIIIQYGAFVPLETNFLKGAFTSINDIEEQTILDALIRMSVGL